VTAADVEADCIALPANQAGGLARSGPAQRPWRQSGLALVRAVGATASRLFNGMNRRCHGLLGSTFQPEHNKGDRPMDYQAAEQQAMQIRQQSQDVLQKMQSFAQQLRTDAKDEDTGRELAMDMKEIAMSVQGFNQSALLFIQQMAQYVQQLEQQLQTHPQPTIQPRGWAQQAGGGGFLGNLVSGLGMGAGFGLAEDVVGDIFNQF